MKIYRDKLGKVINIGEWDYVEETITDEETYEESIVQHNPLPKDAIESDEEVVEGWDGGLYAHDDERQLQ